MNLKNIKVENFKCFENLELEFGNITLLTGANSSGKTSAIYSILIALQSPDFPFYLSTNGKYVNMGDYEDVAFLHSKSNEIRLTYNFDEEQLDTVWIFDKQNKLPLIKKVKYEREEYMLTLEFDYGLKKHKGFFKYLGSDSTSEPTSGELFYKLETTIYEAMYSDDEKKVSGLLKKAEKKIKRNKKDIRFEFVKQEDFRDKIDEKGSYMMYLAHRNLQRLMERFDKHITYISSFRFHPQKLKFETSKADISIGKYGDNYEDQIVLWERNEAPQFTELKKICQKVGLLQDLKTKRTTGGNYELKIKTHAAGVFSSITDVGFGISQFLPIVVADIQLGANSTLFISQPELHLHPSLQSNFGDYLVEQIKSQNKRYVIETHSEYLINKLRLCIVKSEVDENTIVPYFFEKNKDNVEKHTLRFCKTGEIKDAPDTFFTTYMSDVMAIAMNS